MNILRKCMELWNKFKKAGGIYLRTLLILLGVVGALFAGHKFDASADNGATPIVDDTLWVYVTADGILNMPAVSDPDDYYKPFNALSSWDDHQIGDGFYIMGPGGDGAQHERYFSGSPGKKPELFGDRMSIYVGREYDVVSDDNVYYSGGDCFAGGDSGIALKNSTTRYDYHVKIVAKKPRVIIKDIDGTDISDKFDISSDFQLAEYHYGNIYKYVLNSLTIREGSTLPPGTVEKLNLEEGGTSFSYNNTNFAVSIENYQGSDIVFNCTGKTYFGSESNSGTWTNQALRNGYTMKLNGTDEVSISDDISKGAWMIEYPVYDEPSSWNLTLVSKTGYEFENICNIRGYSDGATTPSYSSTATPTDNNKKLAFNITNNWGKKNKIVTIGGQKYSEYKNTFKYGNVSCKLTDLVDRIYYYLVIDQSKIPKDTINGEFVQTWTIAGISGSTIVFLYYAYPCSGYEFDRDTTVSVNGNQLPWNEEDGWQDGYYAGYDYRGNNAMEIVYNSTFQDNEIVINNIKKHYDVKFIPKEGSSVQNDININSSASNWNTSITENTALDGEFSVTLDLVNDRKIFKSADEIKSAIIGANSDLSDLKCTRISDTKIALTIPHSTSPREITIPDSVLIWKTSNADFSIDFTGIDDIYKDEAMQSVELYTYKENGEQGDLIPLKKTDNYTLVNVDTQTGIPYDSLKFILKLKDGSYLDLSNASVAIDGGHDGETGKEATASNLVFRLDPDCPGAPYRSNIKFRIGNLKSSLKDVNFTLCPKASLYLKKSDGSLTNLVNAPSDSPTNYTAWVPDAGATYVVVYTDYSKEFNKDNIKVGSNVEIDDKDLESFNRVSFKVRPLGSADRAIILEDPAKTAPPVKFTPVEGAKYYNVNDDKTINYESSIQGTINIPYETDFSFAVECNEGFDPATLEIKANGTAFSESSADFKKEKKDDYYVFTISATKAIYPITITGNVHATQRTITFNKELGGNFGTCSYIYNGASISGNVTVLYGQGIAFEVNLPENCNQSDIKVKFNDEELTKVNGKYVKNNITSDGTVTVTNVSLNKYPVTFASNSRASYKKKDGSNLSGTAEVSHGDSFEFRVQPNSGYTMGQDSVVYLKYADGRTTTLQPSNDVYKISNLTQACTVSVENVEDIVYTVKLVASDGVTYRNDVDNVIKDYVKIKHGRNFEFSVLLSDEYDDSLGGMNIIVNDGKSSQSSAQKIASGRYVIPNVSEDITIKVGNVRKNTYTVTLTGAEGIDYYNSSGKIITGDNQAEHHSDFSFKVDLYPAYVGSDITVMLGDTPMSADSNGFYTIHKISESKTVTVVGIEMNDSSELVGKINNLPDSLNNLSDVDDVIAATKAYESLSDAEKALIGNADKLRSLQEQVKEFHHVSNDVRVSGVDWYIKLYAIPITDDADACGRIYKKLGSEYILSLYNVYLWNTLTDTRYTLPEGQSAVITLPTPDMTYFEKPTAIHEKDGGKIEYISASINKDTTTFQTDSFSPMGIIANRSSTPGRSSLLDAADANLDAISNFAASLFGNDTNRVTRSGSERGDYGDLSGDSSDDNIEGNIDEKFRSRNNRVTAVSSALRLALVLMILILIGLMIYFFIKRRKDKKDSGEE